MSCLQTLSDYGLRSLGYGARILPKSDITICEQFVLIGSGMIWNIYFGVLALFSGFSSRRLGAGQELEAPCFNLPSRAFIFIFRGSPLFIQFFFAYDLFVLLPRLGVDIELGFMTVTVETRWLTRLGSARSSCCFSPQPMQVKYSTVRCGLSRHRILKLQMRSALPA